jgi:hypothetical protein
MIRLSLFVWLIVHVQIFSYSQGTGCTTPVPITMDGVCRNYTISSATGSNLVCTSSGITPVTYFSVTSNSSAENMLLKITGPSNQPVEVAFYDGTSCTNGNLESASSICFYDGTGDWAPAENFVITPNTTYILRIKTATTGTIQICGQHYTPPNNDCLGAKPLGTELLVDNNAAHRPGNEVSPASVCAVVLENTAFYKYTVDISGPTSLAIEGMNCDNNYESDLLNLGFQIGFFTGTCAGLTPINCYSGVNGNAQLNVGTLPTGTQVYVAIDGILGSNCEYAIRAINAVVLTAKLKQFTVWKNKNENLLNWTTSEEDGNAFFEIHKSIDGRSFAAINRVNGQGNSTTEKSYEYRDEAPPPVCYYRLKLVDINGKATYSKVIRVERKADINTKVKLNNVVSNLLSLQVRDLAQDNATIEIIDPSGRQLYQRNVKISAGENNINVNTSGLSGGVHYLIFSTADYKQAIPFIKL